MKKNKRNVFGDLMNGITAMKKHRRGKITLRTHKPEPFILPEVEGDLIRDTRERLGLSQRLFAEVLHMNPRTLANWEQDHSKPNEQAAVLILLVRKFPDILKRLRKLAA